MASTRTTSPAYDPSGYVALTTYNTNGFAQSEVVVAVPCRVKEIRVGNNSGATRYAQVFNATTVPADGATPSALPMPIINGGVAAFTWQGAGEYFGTGLSWASSTTWGTKTLGGDTDLWVEIDYSTAI